MILLSTTFESIVSVGFLLLGIYLIIGFVFAIFFVWKGAAKMDHNVVDTSIWFRLLIFPGSIAFWPILLKKWRSTTS